MMHHRQQQQQHKPHQILFLDDYLRTTTTSTPTINSKSDANSIISSWSHLRSPSILSNPSLLLSSLLTLSSHPPSSLHLSDAHCKLLLSLLSSSSSSNDHPSLPQESLPFISRLLYSWLRKSPSPPNPLLSSLLSHLPLLLSPPPSSSSLLLLSALSAAPSLPSPSRISCLNLLLTTLNQTYQIQIQEPPDILAAVGYALSCAEQPHFTQFLDFLFRLKTNPNINYALMVLHLFEWLVSGFINKRFWNRIEWLCEVISDTKSPRFALVMAAVGSLRACRLNYSSNPIDARLKRLMEGKIVTVAASCVGEMEEEVLEEKRLLRQCVSLGLVRCGQIGFRGPVFLCVCYALLEEVFPLRDLIKAAAEDDENGSLEVVRRHLDGILFKEAGAVTGVFCNQYTMADEEHKGVAENCIWDYSRELYYELRRAVILLRGKNTELIGNLNKIAEAAFLMVVVFAAEVTKQKLNSKMEGGFRPEIAVMILVAFSCIEYLRRVRLPEYTEAVRRSVLTVQENAAACALFVESLPPYAELTNQRGPLAMEGLRYAWWEDEVQTARMLFCLRVIPTCISLVPASMFGKLVAPTMFLYMRHPNEKVARASHSVFVAFVSSGKDSEQDDRWALKEQLVFYYVQRSLEAYPGVTPFEGLASGVAALVRYLPAGSPAIFYCIHSLVEKAAELCSRALNEDATMWENWEGNSEPCKKVLDLLLRFIALVDIQVLPYLLKQLAEFVAQLPEQGQNVLLDEMYAQVAESDDVTRKPVLVSWLQSLSYLCSQKNATSVKKGCNRRLKDAAASFPSDGSLGLNRTSSRL